MLITKKVRCLLALTLTAVVGSVSAQTVTAVEFYSKSLDAFFITARSSEQQILDGLPDFVRTGMSFETTDSASSGSGSTRVCRFYIGLASPPTSSHFYGREGTECQQIQAQNLPGFSYEGFDFSIAEPVSGVCTVGTTAVYRSFRAGAAGKTANHRYTTSPQSNNTAQTQGYAPERVVFCANSATDVRISFDLSQNCGTFYYPGIQISYQSSMSNGTQTTFQRSMNSTSTSFYGQSDATAVADRFADGTIQSLMILNSLSNWTVLGTSNLDANGRNDIYYSDSTVYPRNFASSESVPINRQLFYSGFNTFGVTQTGSVAFAGRESVSVPLGTYSNACKFVTQIVTKYPGAEHMTTTVSTNWIANRVGVVRTVTDTDSVLPSGARTQLTTTNSAIAIQSF